MHRIKIAQIGTSRNSHGSDIFWSLRKQSDIFEVVGYAFPENEREKYPERMYAFEGAREMTVEEILNDPEIEAVTVETEECYLTKYAQMVADAGKHMHMEKPGGYVLADFEKLIATVKKNQTVFHTGYMYRYNPYVIELMESIKKGELGEIISVEAQMNCRHSDELRSWLKNYKGGSMFFLGCHLIDLIFRIKGAPEHITVFNRSTGLDGIDSEDFGMVAMEYKNGVSFAKVNSTEVGGFSRRQLVVAGSKKTIELNPLEMFGDGGQFTTRIDHCADKANWGDRGIITNTEIYDRYDAMMRSFAQMVCKEKENPYTYDYELELYRTILKCCNITD